MRFRWYLLKDYLHEATNILSFLGSMELVYSVLFSLKEDNLKVMKSHDDFSSLQLLHCQKPLGKISHLY